MWPIWSPFLQHLVPDLYDAIGFQKPCTITLKTSVDSIRSWQVGGIPYKNSSYKLGSGWKKFSKENGHEDVDICIFNAIKTILLLVHLSHCKQKISWFRKFVNLLTMDWMWNKYCNMCPFCLIKDQHFLLYLLIFLQHLTDTYSKKKNRKHLLIGGVTNNDMPSCQILLKVWWLHH